MEWRQKPFVVACPGSPTRQGACHSRGSLCLSPGSVTLEKANLKGAEKNSLTRGYIRGTYLNCDDPGQRLARVGTTLNGDAQGGCAFPHTDQGGRWLQQARLQEEEEWP